MERESFTRWLNAYRQAWMGRDPKAAAELYTAAATYQVTPFSEPLHGREAIFGYWLTVAKTQQKIQFDYEVVAVTAEHGIAR